MLQVTPAASPVKENPSDKPRTLNPGVVMDVLFSPTLQYSTTPSRQYRNPGLLLEELPAIIL
jgi:hypothetical protein